MDPVKRLQLEYDEPIIGPLSRTNKQKFLNEFYLLNLKKFPDGTLPFGHATVIQMDYCKPMELVTFLDLIFSFLLFF